MTDSTTLKKALFAIKKLKQIIREQQNNVFQPIALIGLSCRYPNASNKEDYWQLLSSGTNVITRFPESRRQLLKETEESCIPPGWGSFLTDIDHFDAYFFGITPREAMRMDPQQRLLLEVAYEAFEDAGISVEVLAGSATGVFTSLYASQFGHMQTFEQDLDALYIPTGNAASMAANRLSYQFDLRGPSMVLDTACSASLVAIHLACLNLQAHFCEMALVSAANINLLPSFNTLLAKAKMLSPTGQCHTFDASADGYVQGEGIGAVVLKPLAKALQDQDRIYGVIMGSAVNQDGKTNGLTAPNGMQQEALLKAAYQTANIDPHEISYIECHGTGTFLGDPIEVQALGEVIGKQRSSEQPCWIGSVKANIGHLEPAAGIASLIKVALALQYGHIPPQPNFSTPNPHIAFDRYHLRVPQQLEPWPIYGEKRVAGLSGFGFGGTNAHVVMRELTLEEQTHTLPTVKNEAQVFTLSAKDPTALKLLIQQWCTYLTKHPDSSLSQLCYNLHLRRSHYFNRLAIIASTIQELHATLKKLSEDDLQTIEQVFINVTQEKIVCAVDQPITRLALDYVNRVAIDWKKQHAEHIYPHQDMPLYPWQPKLYWPSFKKTGVKRTYTYPFKKTNLASPLSVLQFEFQFNTQIMPEIVDSYNFLHAGYSLEMLAYAVAQLSQEVTFTVKECSFLSPIFVPHDTDITVQLILDKQVDQHFSFSFYSRSTGQAWTCHTKGTLSLTSSSAKKINLLEKTTQRYHHQGSAEEFFARVTAMRMPSGDSIRWAKSFSRIAQEILCEFAEPVTAQRAGDFQLKVHLGVIDGCIQSLFMLLPETLMHPYIASNIGEITYYGLNHPPAYLLAELTEIVSTGERFRGNFYLMDHEGEIIVQCHDLCMTRLNINVQVTDATKTIGTKIDWSMLSLADAQSTIRNFLVNQVSALFSMPEVDIDVNQSLSVMGIDSLMSIVLNAAIETNLGETIPMRELLKGPTITELVDLIIHKKQLLSITSNNSNWISYRKKSNKPQARLFCFPYGGSGASIYRDWQQNLADFIEVCPIQLPGRENRLDEAPANELAPLIHQLVEHLQPEWDLPFAFFGHSFGSLIAFELTRALRKQNLPQPFHLFVSAFPDPRIPTKSLDKVIARLQTLKLDLFDLRYAESVAKLNDAALIEVSCILSESGLLEFGHSAMNKEFLKIFLPIFINDMSLVKNYQYQSESPLDVPLTVFTGQRDTWVNHADHLGWTQHTRNVCDFQQFDSHHLFIREVLIKKRVLENIQQCFEKKVYQFENS